MRGVTRYLTIVIVLYGCRGAAASSDDSTAAVSAQASAPAIDWAKVDSAFGRTGAMQPGDVRRYSMPRGDLRVTAAGVTIRPGFALGSWTAMKAHGTGVVAMGDLVLAERAGFVLASAVLFWFVARAFDPRHPLRDLAFAVSVSIGAYVLFGRVLDLQLPGGVLAAWL